MVFMQSPAPTSQDPASLDKDRAVLEERLKKAFRDVILYRLGRCVGNIIL